MGKVDSYKYRTVSSDFAVFLNTFLIISTLIVFAVLVFISYQNIKVEYTNNVMESSASACADAANDYLLICESYDAPEDRDRLIGIYLRSNLISDNGSVYIVDSNGSIKYSNGVFNHDNVTFITKSAVNSVISMGDGLYQDYVELTGTSSQIVSAMNIQDTGLYSVVITDFNISNYSSEYLSIILYPVIAYHHI